jgi:voltage-gated potassium channel Kch
MKQRIIVSIIVVFLIALGLWGQYLISPTRFLDGFTTVLYEILLLFFFSGDWTLALDSVPLQIELVRFLAPLAAVTSLFLVFASNTRILMGNRLVRYYSDHIIVVGLGDKSWQFLRTCHPAQRVVVVERNPDNLLIHRARLLGIRVLVGDIFEDSMLARVNVAQASQMIAFTGDDGTNVELAIKTRTLIRSLPRDSSHLKIHIHLNEIGLAQQLESYPKFFADYSLAEIAFFSVYDLSARLLLRDYPPDVFADVANQARVHLAIYGFQRLAEKLVIEAALMCQYANGSRLRFSIFDADADGKCRKFSEEYPHLAKICDYTFIQQTTMGPQMFTGSIAEILPSVTQHIVCTDSDEESLTIALKLRGALLDRRASNAPILVRMQRTSGLAQLLESNTGEQEIPDGLYPFGMFDEVLQVDNVLTSQLDQLARVIHQMYLEAQLNNSPTIYQRGGSNIGIEQSAIVSDKSARGDSGNRHLNTDPPSHHQALQLWNDLPQWERKQNLLKADHWPIRLRAIRCLPTHQVIDVPDFTLVEATTQAKMEHNRYVNTKRYEGWQYGETRVEEAKINPFLIPWEKLSPEQQQREIGEVAIQPDYFARRSGIFTQRKFILGVTGHRLTGEQLADKSLLQQLKTSLLNLKQKYANHQFTILSPVAEGADRLVARMAMSVLDAALQVPLPLPYDLYIQDFSSKASQDEFKTLIGKAEFYYELPMRFGNIRELAVGRANSINESRNKQYALAGAYIAQRVDQLIAIYDGKPAAGTGGTGQIVQWYESGEIDPEYVYADHYFLPPRKLKAIVINSQR